MGNEELQSIANKIHLEKAKYLYESMFFKRIYNFKSVFENI